MVPLTSKLGFFPTGFYSIIEVHELNGNDLPMMAISLYKWATVNHFLKILKIQTQTMAGIQTTKDKTKMIRNLSLQLLEHFHKEHYILQLILPKGLDCLFLITLSLV